MNKFFEENISWNEFASHLRGEFVFNLENTILLQEKMELILDIVSNFVVPYHDVLSMKRKLCSDVGDLKDVNFRFRYDDMIQEESEILQLYIPHMMNSLSELSPIAKTVDESCIKKENGAVSVYLIGEESARRFNDSAAPSMNRKFHDTFGIPVRFVFKNRSEDYEKKVSEQKIQKQEELRQLHEQMKRAVEADDSKGKDGFIHNNVRNNRKNRNSGTQQTNNTRYRREKYEGKIEGNRILGKPIEGEVTPIQELRDGSRDIVIAGEVFKKDSRTMKNGRVLQMLYVTDRCTSICAKIFVSEKKSEEIDEYINTGSYIKLHGNCENDNYEKMTVLMADSMELGEKPARTDNCERKRVELHAHTKMSQFDGLSEVKDLVNTAKRWGHKAVAVTDHGVVQSFPDAAKAAGNDIKVIYGVEGYLVNDTTDASGNLDYRTNKSYHIILIAKNQTGLKNLYKLVSFSYLYYYYKRPRIPRSELIKYREGIIIGSACEAGEVFRAITSGCSDEDVIKIAEFYDYLEIQPRSNNMFMLEKGMVNSEKIYLSLITEY